MRNNHIPHECQLNSSQFIMNHYSPSTSLASLNILHSYLSASSNAVPCIKFCSAILNFVLEGNALKAIELTEELAPKLLENDMDLHFDLLSLHFIELIRARKW
jgi:hypothetical protein